MRMRKFITGQNRRNFFDVYPVALQHETLWRMRSYILLNKQFRFRRIATGTGRVGRLEFGGSYAITMKHCRKLFSNRFFGLSLEGPTVKVAEPRKPDVRRARGRLGRVAKQRRYPFASLEQFMPQINLHPVDDPVAILECAG